MLYEVITGDDMDIEGKTHTRNPSSNDHFSALAFKLINDPYVGQQTFIRIFSGKLVNGMQIYNSSKLKYERIGRRITSYNVCYTKLLRKNRVARDTISLRTPYL